MKLKGKIMKRILLFMLFILILVITGCTISSQSSKDNQIKSDLTAPSLAVSAAKAAVLSKMVLANNYFLAKYPAPGAKADSTHTGNIWTKAVYLEGVMALYRTNSDAAVYNYAVNWGTYFSWNARSGNKTTNADDQCCMQTYEELYQISNQSARLANVTTCMDNMVSLSAVNYWTWIDAIQMSMPIFAKMGVIKGNTKYFTKMYSLFNYPKTTLKLYNTTDHLWYRDANFDPPYTTPNGKQCYWSRGNGWVFVALARVLDVLPSTDSHRAEYLATFKEMAAALKACQRTDGFWNVSLADPNDYGGPETSGTACFTYGMAWGINKGILDSATYLPCVQKGWNGMVTTALQSNGFLGFMQGTGKQPSDGQPLSATKIPNFEDYGLGLFLLAGSEVYKLTP
jgi:unsaturated rhamnogalacturonyl hydrolase